jgi:hypothetical protein
MKDAIAWLRERATERNSKRAIGVLIVVLAYFGFLDPDGLTKGSTSIALASTVWLAIDAFGTKDGGGQ